MSTKQKSIRVPVNFGNPSDVTNNTLTTIGSPTIYIPENSGSNVTFTSVMLYYGWEDLAAGASVNITGIQGQLSLSNTGSISNTTVTVTSNGLLSTAENMGGVFGPFDFTSYFNGGAWSGGILSQSCDVDILINNTGATSTNFRNTIGWLDITYDFDSTSTTSRIQTVCIPYESYITYIPTTATTVATLQQLTGAGGILDGYDSPVLRHRWVEIKVHDFTGQDNQTLSYSFDGGATSSFPQIGGTLQTGRFHTYFADASGLNGGGTHSFQLVSDTANRFQTPVVNEWITFEYTTTATTKSINYIEMPVEFESFPYATEALNSSFLREILLPEQNIEVISAGVEINYVCASGATLVLFKVGNQASYRQYSGQCVVNAGQNLFQHRFDTGSALGEGVALTSGLNTIPIFLYMTTAPTRTISNVSGVAKIAYLSDVSSTGIDNHTQTVRKILSPAKYGITNFFQNNRTTNTGSLSIPNSDYYLQTAGLNYHIFSSAAGSAITCKASLLSGEGAGEGYRVLYTDQYFGDSEVMYSYMHVRARDEFKRYPADIDTNRMDIESNRDYDVLVVNAFRGISGNFVATYSGITHTISGSISNSSNNTSSLQLLQEIDNEYILLKTGSVEGDGQFEFTAYDDTTNYIVTAYVTSSLKGVSKLDLPGEGFDIDLSPAGAGGEFFF